MPLWHQLPRGLSRAAALLREANAQAARGAWRSVVVLDARASAHAPLPQHRHGQHRREQQQQDGRVGGLDALLSALRARRILLRHAGLAAAVSPSSAASTPPAAAAAAPVPVPVPVPVPAPAPPPSVLLSPAGSCFVRSAGTRLVAADLRTAFLLIAVGPVLAEEPLRSLFRLFERGPRRRPRILLHSDPVELVPSWDAMLVGEPDVEAARLLAALRWE